MTPALEVTVTAPVASFRDPLYGGVQVGLPCPPPATVGGMLAAAAGGWQHVSTDLRFAATFRAEGSGTDLETFHPALSTGKSGDPVPKDRPFLAAVLLRLWLLTEVERWNAVLRRPVWPLRLGRSQDLADVRARVVHLEHGSGRQGHALVPEEMTEAGTVLRLPTAVSRSRSRTRWDAYRYAPRGQENPIAAQLRTPDGQAVAPLPPVHPDQLGEADPS